MNLHFAFGGRFTDDVLRYASANNEILTYFMYVVVVVVVVGLLLSCSPVLSAILKIGVHNHQCVRLSHIIEDHTVMRTM